MTPSGCFGKASPEHGATFLGLEGGEWALRPRRREEAKGLHAPAPHRACPERLSPYSCKGLGRGDQEKSQGVPAGQGVKSHASP